MKSSKLPNRFAKRRAGYTIAEFAPTLFLAFVIIVMPLLAFGTLALRYCLLLNAVRVACIGAARASTFQTDISPATGNISSVTTATNDMNYALYTKSSGVGGGMILLDPAHSPNPELWIYATPLAGGTRSKANTTANKAMATPANTSLNTYNIEVIVYGIIQPIFPGASWVKKWFGMSTFVGFTDPIYTQVRWDQWVENPSGLNQ